MTFKVTYIDHMYTNNIVAGINDLKYKAGKFKTLVCKLGDTINIKKYKKVAVIAYRRDFYTKYYLTLNYYRKV